MISSVNGFNAYSAYPQFTAHTPVQNRMEPIHVQKSQNKMSTGTKVLLGGGAAAMIGTAIYFATRGKAGKNTVKKLSQETIDKITQLKEKLIKTSEKIKNNPELKGQDWSDFVDVALDLLTAF